MKLNRTELRNTIGDCTTQVPNAIVDAMEILTTFSDIAPMCVTESDYYDNGGEECDFEFQQLDDIETALSIPYPNALKIIADNHAAKDYVLARRLKNAMEYYQSGIGLIRDYTTAYVPLSEDEINKLTTCVNGILGHLSMFIYYEFNLDETLQTLEDGTELIVDINIYQYCESQSRDLKDLILYVRNIRDSYRPSLPIFEEHPEYENVFYDIAGPFVQDFDSLEDSLVAEDVLRVVCDDSLDIEEYIKEIENRNGTGEGKNLKELSTF